MSETEKKRSKSSAGKVFCYVVGSVALCATACVVIPMVAPYITGTINKKVNKISNAKKSDDDWGPIIEKKHPEESEEEYNGLPSQHKNYLSYCELDETA